ncbi:DoxX family protein [Paenibacillus sp. sptzw28]|uniref:DoxX family protein n=1 Tax=Paenibacillus sp. sptzw28 TaxID=715179 RepID=UPI001C6E43B2|nr:DoxX family protein [Paenibacillus sp. sptzw28]QYR19119.1 DoxX family protein [Paenibacillus sp. sptzw28]
MEKNVQIGGLIIRFVLGVIFFMHGLQKFQGGIGNTAGFFQSMGIPGFLAYAVGTIELVGGILIILGLGTRVIAALFALIMLVAILKVKLKAGFVGGYEYEIALLSMSLFFTAAGHPYFSLDNLLNRRKQGATVKLQG